ncbi:MAG TPA: hypothetical protein VFO70_05005, partial [Chitinophagaceae bacterium]|nr:hypothetical protein [Chitinophagaceae bacterium]
MNKIGFNDRIRQIIVLSIIILLLYVVIIELEVFLPGLLGAITLYILSRGQYFQLTYNRKWKKGWAAMLFIFYYLFLIGLPVFLSITLISPKIDSFLDDPAATLAGTKQSIMTIQKNLGFKFFSEAALDDFLNRLSNYIPTILNSTANL